MSLTLKVITLTMDGREVGAHEEQSILEVARENGIEIPTLCHLEGLTPIGSCRLCLVEVAGSNKLLPACVTKVAQGMVVNTNTERLKKYRRLVLELIFSERNHICAVCVSNGNCELQSRAQKEGMHNVHVPYRYPRLKVDASHERFVLDHNRCILCARCVRVCDEVEGAHTWDMMGRGIQARVITDLNQAWGSSTSCTSCGKCVHVCPTGSLFEKGKSVTEMRKHTQFLPYLSTMRGER